MLVELPAISRSSERLLGPLQALLVDGSARWSAQEGALLAAERRASDFVAALVADGSEISYRGQTYAWIGDGAPRTEVAHVDRHGRQLTASGTQLGAAYELRYRLEPQTLSLELVGERSTEIALGDADFFDLAGHLC